MIGSPFVMVASLQEQCCCKSSVNGVFFVFVPRVAGSPSKLKKKNAFKIEDILTKAANYFFQPLADVTRPCFEPLFNRALYCGLLSRNSATKKRS